MMNADRTDLITAACSFLDATRYASDTLFAYRENQCPCCVFLVTDDDISELGARLIRGEDDAYSCWCHDTTAVEVNAKDIARNLFAAHVRDLYPDEVRAAAARAGDIDTVAAMDHISDAVAEALGELWDEHDYEAEVG